jgi:hypothetical protein
MDLQLLMMMAEQVDNKINYNGFVSKTTWAFITSNGPPTDFKDTFYYHIPQSNFSIKLIDFNQDGTINHDDEWYWFGLWDSVTQTWIKGLDSTNLDALGIWFQDTSENCNINKFKLICQQFTERFTNAEWSTQKASWRSGTHSLIEIIRRAKLWKYCN